MEPFYGGSHRDFAQGLVAHSRHDIQMATLPARFWKWRMRGAALHFFRTIDDISAFDGLVVSNLMSLSDFTALHGGRRPPTLAYFHENQLTYPLAPGERMDMQFGFTDITTALCADRVLFNSRFHFDQFFATLPGFIGRMPEFKPRWAIDAIREKAGVLHPGCRFDADPLEPAPLPPGPPLIVWNHRWEFDKNPGAFFSALDRIDQMGIDFQVALLGENYQARPKAFVTAKSRFAEKIVQYGFVESREAYRKWLKKGAVVVSTANQENFGISVVEAVRTAACRFCPIGSPILKFYPTNSTTTSSTATKRIWWPNWRRSQGSTSLRRDPDGAFQHDGPPRLVVMVDRYDRELDSLTAAGR
jgi:glycosyltransferase involved in cell wall biosynthesis